MMSMPRLLRVNSGYFGYFCPELLSLGKGGLRHSSSGQGSYWSGCGKNIVYV